MAERPEFSGTSRGDRGQTTSRPALLWRGVGGALVVFAVAAAVRALGLGQEALHDELFHFLAAKNYLAEGTLSIISGAEPYTRARPFTLLVAWTMEKLEATLQMARLPALAAGSALAALVFTWLRAHGERLAAWIAGLLICLDPLLIELSQIVRFYSLQHLAFAAGAIGLFEAYRFRDRLRLSAPLAVAGLALLYAAFRLQSTALIGVAGIGVALVASAAIGLWNRLDRTRFVQIALVVGTVAVAGFVLVGQTDWFQDLLAVALQVDAWQRSAAGDLRYYYAILHGTYAPLWSLVPLLFVLGFRRQRKIVFYAAAIFAVGFLVHSLVPRKAQRYFVYLLPFLFVVFAAGIAAALPHLRNLGTRFADFMAERIVRLSDGAQRVLALGVIVAILGSAAVGNHAFLESYRLATRDHSFTFPLMGPFDGTLSWERAAAEIRSEMGKNAVVVAADDLKAIHYLGRLDYSLSPSNLSLRTIEDREFARDPRTDRPVVTEPASIEKIIRCHRRGVIVVQSMSWNNDHSVPDATAEYIQANTTPMELPPKWGLKVFRWTNSDPTHLPRCRSPSAPA